MLLDQKYVNNLKRKVVNLDLLFNTKQKEKDVKATSFMIRNSVKINSGTDDFATASCNGVPMTCNAGEEVTITATYPIGVNEIFADCEYKEVSAEAQTEIFQVTTEEWAIEEATYAYSTITGTDITAEIAATNPVNIYDEIIEALKVMVNRKYSKKDMIVVLDEIYSLELDKMDLSCCDLAVKTSDAKSTMAKKLGVKEVVEVTSDVLNGNLEGVELLDTEKVKFRIYVPELHPVLDYCKTPLNTHDYSGEQHQGVTRIYGKELIGAGEIQAGDSEVHMYFADPTVTP